MPRRNRKLAIIAAAVWLVVFALLGVLLLHPEGDADVRAAADVAAPGATTSTSATTTTVVAAASGVTSAPTTTLGNPQTAATQATVISTTTSSTVPPVLTLAAGGDVMGDRGPGTYIDSHGGPAVFAKVKPFLDKAQIGFVNLEGPISNVGSRLVGKEYTFRARPGLADGLADAGIDVVSMANNHIVDYGQAALKDCLLRLNRAGIAHAGAGLNSAAAATPAILITPAGTVSVLAFTEILPSGFAATADHGGVNPVTQDRKRVLDSIKAAAKKTDFVVVSVHWGIEYDAQANSEQRSLAHQMIDAGADIILGHHPHVIQGLELYRGRLIAYSLGDFVFDHWSRATGEAFILQVSLPREGRPTAQIVPVYVGDSTGVPAPAEGSEAATILDRLIRLSAKLGLTLIRDGNRATLAEVTASR